jgi:hypothetical protein
MRRFARSAVAGLAASVLATGCGEDTKPTGKDAPPPNPKQVEKEGPRPDGPKSK